MQNSRQGNGHVATTGADVDPGTLCWLSCVVVAGCIACLSPDEVSVLAHAHKGSSSGHGLA